MKLVPSLIHGLPIYREEKPCVNFPPAPKEGWKTSRKGKSTSHPPQYIEETFFQPPKRAGKHLERGKVLHGLPIHREKHTSG
jgi:hypothetical protein